MSFDAFSVDLNVNSSSDHHFATASDHHDDTYSRYGGYSSFTGVFPSDGDVAVDHTAAASPEIYGFSDQNPGYSQSPFESVIAENENENGNGYGDGDDIFVSDGPVLPPPGEMEPEEDEELFLANQENFHKDADKAYWKTIAQLIPREVPNIEKKRGKKDQEKKPSITVVQGPKPGKPTDLARMRQILLKLKHTPPPNMIHPPPAPAKETASKTTGSAAEGAPASPSKDATSHGASDELQKEASATESQPAA